MPALLHLSSETDYRNHFVDHVCCGKVVTNDGIRVYFRRDAFDHAFFESSKRDGGKDTFSPVRAERMDWIIPALKDPTAKCYQGWNSKRSTYDATRRVTVVRGDFVIVLQLRTNKHGALVADFVTCFVADNSSRKIHSSPSWTLSAYHQQTGQKQNGR
jgi:hypothetical protein